MPEESSNTVRIYYPEFSLEKVVELIRKGLSQIQKSLPLNNVILFGSYAQRWQTEAGDIDLLIVYDDPKRDNAHSICWDALRIPQVELHIYTRSEYERLKNSGSTLPREAWDEGVLIWSAHKPKKASRATPRPDIVHVKASSSYFGDHTWQSSF